MLRRIRRAIDRIALSDRSYRFLFEAEPGNEVVSLDCETTGFDPWVDEVISVAAVRIRDRRIHAASAYRALVRPQARVRADSIKVHQLRQQDVAGARPMTEVLPELLHFIGPRPLVGYWVGFDVRMLNAYLLAILNIKLPNRQVDVAELYYDRKYGNAPPGTRIDLRFTSILRDLGLPQRPQHDAFEDAIAAAETYVLLDDMRRRGVRLPRRPHDVSGSFPLG
jgi:DNA polymerase-3 subunit epsilon